MKRLRQICAVTILTILLANFAAAEEGTIHPWYLPPPTPASPAAECSCPTPSEEVKTMGEEPTTDLATEITLHIIQNMLALF